MTNCQFHVYMIFHQNVFLPEHRYVAICMTVVSGFRIISAQNTPQRAQGSALIIVQIRSLRDKKIYSQVTSGSVRCSLNALKKWCWMVKPQIQSRSYQGFLKVRSNDRSFFSSSLMIFLIISGHLFASLLMIVCFIGI